MTKTEKETAVEQSNAAKLWDQIKDLPIDIFSLPNQTIKDHAKREDGMDSIFPNDVYITLRSAAAYPAIEDALGTAIARKQVKLGKTEKFDLSQQARYTVIKVVPKDL
jgi:hypothetical protein